ncbi:MAG: hypothetical protein J6V41_02420 [Kiritimatiellae bacterium]|nr:hypothetical protein [Kiritimatiellia bacterium]
MKTKMFLTALCGVAIAMLANTASAENALEKIKDGSGSRSGRSEGFRAGIICEQDYVSGVTLALASNIDNEAHAFEFAFLVNTAEKDSSGFQWGYFWGNYVNKGNFGGVQWGFIQNRVGGNMTGWQSSFINLVDGDFCGLQTGLYNCVEGKMTGVQWGWVNQACKDASGLQMGLVNLTDGKISGVQWGFYNQTKDLYGVQIGLVNRLVNYDKWPFTVLVRAVF